MTDSIPWTDSISQLKGFLKVRPKTKTEVLAIVFQNPNKEFKHHFSKFIVLNGFDGSTQKIRWFCFFEVENNYAFLFDVTKDASGKFVLKTPVSQKDNLQNLISYLVTDWKIPQTGNFLPLSEDQPLSWKDQNVAGVSKFQLLKEQEEAFTGLFSSWKGFLNLTSQPTENTNLDQFDTLVRDAFQFREFSADGTLIQQLNPFEDKAKIETALKPLVLKLSPFFSKIFVVTEFGRFFDCDALVYTRNAKNYRVDIKSYFDGSTLKWSKLEESNPFDIGILNAGLNFIVPDLKPWRVFLFFPKDTSLHIVFKSQTSSKESTVHCLRFFCVNPSDNRTKRRYILQQDLLKSSNGSIPYAKNFDQLLEKVKKLFSSSFPENTSKFLKKELRWITVAEMRQMIFYTTKSKIIQVERPQEVALRESKKTDYVLDALSNYFLSQKEASRTQQLYSTFLDELNDNQKRCEDLYNIGKNNEVKQIFESCGKDLQKLREIDGRSLFALFLLLEEDKFFPGDLIFYQSESELLDKVVSHLNFFYDPTKHEQDYQKNYLSPDFNDVVYVPMVQNIAEIDQSLKSLLSINEKWNGVFQVFLTPDCIGKPFDMLRVLDVSRKKNLNILKSGVSSTEMETKSFFAYQMGLDVVLISANNSSFGTVVMDKEGEFIEQYTDVKDNTFFNNSKSFLLDHQCVHQLKLSDFSTSNSLGLNGRLSSIVQGLSEVQLFDFLLHFYEQLGESSISIQVPSLNEQFLNVFFVQKVDASSSQNSSSLSLFGSSAFASMPTFTPVVVSLPIEVVLGKFRIQRDQIKVYKKLNSKKHQVRWENQINISSYLDQLDQNPQDDTKSISPSQIFKNRLTEMNSSWKEISRSVLLEFPFFQKAFQTSLFVDDEKVVDLLSTHFQVKMIPKEKIQSVWKNFIEFQRRNTL